MSLVEAITCDVELACMWRESVDAVDKAECVARTLVDAHGCAS